MTKTITIDPTTKKPKVKSVKKHEPHPLLPDFTADKSNLAGKIAAGLWSVNLTVGRPDGEYVIKGHEVTYQGKTVDHVRSPKFIIDTPSDHPLWGEIDAMGRQMNTVVDRYSFNDTVTALALSENEDDVEKTQNARPKKRKGFHLVPSSRTGPLLAELRKLNTERMKLVQSLQADYDTWINNLKVKYPDTFHILQPLLPTAAQLPEKFVSRYVAEEMTPIVGSKLNLDGVNPVDAEQIRGESNRMAQDIAKARATVMFDQVFGSMLTTCDEISKGCLKSGTRKMGGIRELVDGLERLKNFGEFVSPDVSAQAEKALAEVSTITDIGDLNANKGDNALSNAITTAFKPLQESLERAMKAADPESGRAARRLR